MWFQCLKENAQPKQKDIRAHSKITSHYIRRYVTLGSVTKTQNTLDIPARSRFASRTPQHLNCKLLWREPLAEKSR